MRVIVAVLVLVLACGTAGAQLPGVEAGLLEQAPRPNPAAPLHRHVGEQYRVYEFPGTGEPIPYRLFVPESWTPERKLPVLVTLRAGNSINNSHRGGNELVKLARERGYIVISPLGYRGYSQPYYGSPYPVDREAGPSAPASGWSAEENQRAERDVLYVLNLVAAEYNADTSRLFLHGQNPAGSAAFHFAARYPGLFKAIIVSAGPIITTGFPFGNLKDHVAVMLLSGEKDASYTAMASRRVARELQEHGVEAEFHLVPGAEHLNPYLLHAPQVYDFLDKH